ncbi:MAG: hypothetical protein QOG14_3213 [Mycobacterium sp.]|jgi:hypothetical protein|nr:hypothetical protein [Mycobacterium sp.]
MRLSDSWEGSGSQAALDEASAIIDKHEGNAKAADNTALELRNMEASVVKTKNAVNKNAEDVQRDCDKLNNTNLRGEVRAQRIVDRIASGVLENIGVVSGNTVELSGNLNVPLNTPGADGKMPEAPPPKLAGSPGGQLAERAPGVDNPPPPQPPAVVSSLSGGQLGVRAPAADNHRHGPRSCLRPRAGKSEDALPPSTTRLHRLQPPDLRRSPHPVPGPLRPALAADRRPAGHQVLRASAVPARPCRRLPVRARALRQVRPSSRPPLVVAHQPRMPGPPPVVRPRALHRRRRQFLTRPRQRRLRRLPRPLPAPTPHHRHLPSAPLQALVPRPRLRCRLDLRPHLHQQDPWRLQARLHPHLHRWGPA